MYHRELKLKTNNPSALEKFESSSEEKASIQGASIVEKTLVHGRLGIKANSRQCIVVVLVMNKFVYPSKVASERRKDSILADFTMLTQNIIPEIKYAMFLCPLVIVKS